MFQQNENVACHLNIKKVYVSEVCNQTMKAQTLLENLPPPSQRKNKREKRFFKYLIFYWR